MIRIVLLIAAAIFLTGCPKPIHEASAQPVLRQN